MKNTIYTIEEYIAQGFTAEEAIKVRKTDEMFNDWDNLTEEEKEEYFALVEELGLLEMACHLSFLLSSLTAQTSPH